MLVPALIVAVVFLYGVVCIGFYTLRKMRDQDWVGVFIGMSLIVIGVLFGV